MWLANGRLYFDPILFSRDTLSKTNQLLANPDELLPGDPGANRKPGY